jgi:integrase
MAWLQKKLTTVYIDRSGARVPKGTPGAIKKQIESDKWYGCWKDGKDKVMIPLATDKQASQAMLTDIIRHRERGEAGLVNPYKPHLDRAIEEHMTEYLAALRDEDRTAFYMHEKERILKLIFRTAGIKKLRDLTADRIDRYLAQMTKGTGKVRGLPVAASTKIVHRTAANAFANWLKRKGRLPNNPLENVAKPQGKAVRERRSLTPTELQRLLVAARERPLRDAMTNTGGRRPDGAPKTAVRSWAADVRPEVQERYRLLGRERALLYKTAVLTGLRQGELAALRVAFLKLDRKPFPALELPGEFTKNGEDARVLLVPALAEELRQWIADTGKKTTDPVFTVSEKANKIFRRDLRAAGIPYRDDLGRYADFHALRHSANTMLGVAGIPPKLRQLFMRHSDIRLTTATYDDETLYEMQPVVKALEALDLQ